MSAHLIAVVVGLCVYVFIAAPKLGWLSASSLLVYMQFNLVFGTLLALQPDLAADRRYGELLLWAFFTILSVTIIMSLGTKKGYATFSGTISQVRPGVAMRWLTVVSIAVSTMYFLAIGYIAVFEAFESLISGEEKDIAGLRINSYSGSEYYFPGYVNQFKNVILPSLTLVTGIYLFTKKKASRWALTVPLSLISIILLLGTGQRGAFVQFLVVIAVAIFYMDRKKFFRRIALTAGIATPFLLVSTFALGRSRDDFGSAIGPTGQVGVLFQELYDRVFSNNQDAGIFAFRYIETQPTQWGAQWGDALISLLPGVRSVYDIDNHVFSLVYGSTRGTMPPSIWGSTYYNWGFLGVVIAAALLAVIAFWLTTTMRDRKTATPLEIVGYAGVCAVLASWIAGSPTFLFNSGLAAYTLLWLWGRHQTKRGVERERAKGSAENISDRSRVGQHRKSLGNGMNIKLVPGS